MRIKEHTSREMRIICTFMVYIVILVLLIIVRLVLITSIIDLYLTNLYK